MMRHLSLIRRVAAEPIRVVRLEEPLSVIGSCILMLVTMMAVVGFFSSYPIGADVDPNSLSLPPSAHHWLGTDHLGRDVFWRLVVASQSFVGPGLLSVLVTAVVGIPAGALAGYSSALIASPIRFLFSTVSSIPRFVLVLLVCTIYGNDLTRFALITGIAYAPVLGEDIRARILELRTRDYVLASIAHGIPTWRILWIHLVLGACGKVIARHLLGVFGFFLVLEATLSYIGGVGVQEPVPSWGNMLAFEWGRSGLISVLAPASAIWLTVAAVGWLSDALREEDRHRG